MAVIVAGVTGPHASAVVGVAAELAAALDASLACVWVDVTRIPMSGVAWSIPIDPESDDAGEPQFPADLTEQIEGALHGLPIRWTAHAVTGDTALSIMRIADDVDAALIVVGARDKGARAAFREFVEGSVAVSLAHRQFRPVVVVPTNPERAGHA